MSAAVQVVRPGSRRVPEGGQTPGMEREEAFAAGGEWIGFVRSTADTASGWHHHGTYETYVYVLDGALRVEHGPGGSAAAEAESGDFMRIPAQTVHRELARPAGNELVVVRFGKGGPPVTNAEGPEG